MNTESLMIVLDIETGDPRWTTTYRGWAETPAFQNADSPGQSEMHITVVLSEHHTLSNALEWVKAWAAGSGFKASAPKFEHGNRVDIRLRRP